MRKWLAAIVVLVTIVLPIYGQEKGSHSSGDQGHANSTENPPPPPGTATCKIEEDGTAIECQWPQAVPESKFQRLFSPENAPDIGLFFVGLGGVLVGLGTLILIKKQVIEMRRQVQASHDGLRAWIGIEIRENVPITPLATGMIDQINNLAVPTPPRFVWKLKNSGQTPAFITKMGSHDVYQDTRMLDTLPIPKMREIFDFIGAGKEKENALRISSFMYREVIAQSKIWRVIIKIEYLDVFDKERVHETVASFHYYVPAGEGDPLNAGFYQEHDPANNYNT